MISTIRETITSIKDNSYGNIIVSKRMWPTIWYWSKYAITLSVIPWLIFVFILTYFLPQLPRATKEYFPDISASLKDGYLTLIPSQIYKFRDKDFSFVIDTSASNSSLLDVYQGGVLIASSGAYLKSDNKNIDFVHFPSQLRFSTDKSQVVSWLSSNKFTLWLIGFAIITFSTIATFIFYWLLNLVSFSVGALILLLIARFQKRQLDYRSAVKIAIYAAVPSLLVGSIFSSSHNPIFQLFTFSVFIYFAYNWIKNLHSVSK